VETSCIGGFDARVYSQNGEDGILRYLLSIVGSPARSFVEFGFGIRENNSLRLVLQEHYNGLYLDGFEPTVRVFNTAARQHGLRNVRAECQYLSASNLNEVFQRYGVAAEVDVLSIDVDGVDYWLWQAATSINPRLVAIEFNATMGKEQAVTVPYAADFDRRLMGCYGHYHGASIKAMTNLASRKGYALLGCDSDGCNLFFVRQDLLRPPLFEVAPAVAHRWCAHLARESKDSLTVHDELMRMPLVAV
jgi:hypothetical protein